LPLERSQVQLPAAPLSGNDLGQVVHTRASVAKQYNLVPVAGRRCPATGNWEGNRRSGVALAMRLRLKWFIRAQGLSKGDKHPPTLLMGRPIWYSLPFSRLPGL